MKKVITRRNVSAEYFLDSQIHPILQRIFTSRGIKTKEELEKSLNGLLPYQQLRGIQEAVKLLADAVTQQKNILIVGDFDADGATSSALAVSALRTFGAEKVNYLVPNRFEYGYGLTPEIVEISLSYEPDLIVTVDNGIANHAGVDAAKAAGITVIVTDHHLPAETLPNADAIVNPVQPQDEFPSKCLAGVGVIFYVMLALRTYLRDIQWFEQQNIPEPNMAQFLDLVALGTIADLVSLDRNNRILVHQGVQRIRQRKARPGIQALLAIVGKVPEKLVASDLGYLIVPRLNAAGRLTDMSLGIECLLSDDLNHAQELATQLSQLNDERRLIEKDMQQQAFFDIRQKLESKRLNELPFGVCLFSEKWHQGVIGLLASRVKEQIYRPVVIFAPGNSPEELKGSSRSINGFHIRDALAAIATQHPHLITKFGGHAMAAGLTIQREHFKAFCDAFDVEARRHLSMEQLQGEVSTDGELTHEDFNLQFAELIKEAGPWGQAFPEPIFDGYFRILQQWVVGGHHLKLVLAMDNHAKQLDAIAFNVDLKAWPNHRVDRVRVAYRLDVNEYQGRKTVQLIVEHLEVV